MTMSSSIHAVSIVFITFVCIQSMYRAHGDPGATSFVVAACVLLVLFLLSVGRLETRVKGCYMAAVNLILSTGFAAVTWTVAVVATGFEAYILLCLNRQRDVTLHEDEVSETLQKYEAPVASDSCQLQKGSGLSQRPGGGEMMFIRECL
ncbi:unnamed protein product [Spirodela intermedia]|uniref:Uncharacterized protein n=1 Tax=Spirodela intermedia TaxID=51605 RepID=A0A7I8JDB3_SPIIN|nr:unnamed protein product [Spirodela intermedia]CAA6667991.1 unnamed protein product [Spirodela intermedia]